MQGTNTKVRKWCQYTKKYQGQTYPYLIKRAKIKYNIAKKNYKTLKTFFYKLIILIQFYNLTMIHRKEKRNKFPRRSKAGVQRQYQSKILL